MLCRVSAMKRNLASLYGTLWLLCRLQLLGSKDKRQLCVTTVLGRKAERCLALCRCADGIVLLYLSEYGWVALHCLRLPTPAVRLIRCRLAVPVLWCRNQRLFMAA